LSQDLGVAVRHHALVSEACGLLLFLYQAPAAAAQLTCRPDTLAALLALPNVAGIKEGSWEAAAHEATRRLVRSLRPDVAVMASGDEHLLTCFVLGSEGTQVSLAALMPETVIALEAAADGRSQGGAGGAPGDLSAGQGDLRHAARRAGDGASQGLPVHAGADRPCRLPCAHGRPAGG